MTVLCANLDHLEPVEVRVATQIGIDTGRRPEDILSLPLNCLDRDKDGGDGARLRQHQGQQARPAIADQQGHRRGDHRPATPSPATVPRHPHRETEAAAHARTEIPTGTRQSARQPWRLATATGSPPCRALRTREGIEFDKPGSCPTPTGIPTPNGMPTPEYRSTSWPNCSITEAIP